MYGAMPMALLRRETPAQAVAEQYRGGRSPLRPTATSHPPVLNALILLPATPYCRLYCIDYFSKSKPFFCFFQNFSAGGVKRLHLRAKYDKI